RWMSIFSLMRDGCELAANLRSFRKSILDDVDTVDFRKIVDPYIQVIEGEEICEKTGLRLIDIWRYFRHTWSNPYKSVPGRSYMVLIRDAAVDPHPVIGIAALASSAVQISARDSWIGWAADQFVENLRNTATERHVRWLVKLVSEGINEIYLDDFLDPSQGLLTQSLLASPTPQVINRLQEYARQQRDRHQKLADQTDYKGTMSSKHPVNERSWQDQAESPLFSGKRAETLAMLLRARALLSKGKEPLKARELRQALQTPDARQALQSLVRRAKSERVGVAMADISVCGA